jgi:hypothetical protein
MYKKFITYLNFRKAVLLIVSICFFSNLHGVVSAKDVWKWRYVESELCDDIKVLHKSDHNKFNYNYKAKALNTAFGIACELALAFKWRMTFYRLFTRSSYGITFACDITKYLVFVSSVFILLFIIADYLSTSSDLKKMYKEKGDKSLKKKEKELVLYEEQNYARKFITLPSNLVWNLFARWKKMKRIKKNVIKDFLDNWNEHKQQVPEELHPFFEDMITAYKKEDKKAFEKTINVKLKDLKKMLKQKRVA